MKQTTPEMDSHLASTVTTLCTCWKISRTDEVVFGFTDHDRDLTIDGVVYKAATGYYRTAIATSSDTTVDNVDVMGFFDDASLRENEMRNGAFDYANVQIFAANWADTTMGIVRLRYGYFGEVMMHSSGFFKVELRGLTQLFAQTIGETYAPECRADLGDSRCKIQIVPGVRQSNYRYKLGDRIIVPEVAGVSVNLPLKNPGFEIHEISTGAWTTTSGGVIVWNWKDDYSTVDHFYVHTDSEAGVLSYHETLAQVGAAGTPSFDVDLTINAAGHEVKISCYWASTSGTADTDPTLVAVADWTAYAVGDHTVSLGPLPVSPNDASSQRVYWTVEWRNATAPAGTKANIDFDPSPKVSGDFVVNSALSPATGTLGTAYGWNLTAFFGYLSGPNIWISPHSGDWHLVHAAQASATVQTWQDVDFTTITDFDFSPIDDETMTFALQCYWGAETAGINNFVSVQFKRADGSVISTVAEDEVNMKGRGYWDYHTFKTAMPANTRKVTVFLNSHNYTNNASSHGVFDDVSIRMYQESYEQQQNYLEYGGVEFSCIEAGMSSLVAPTYDYTNGNITIDGAASFQAVNSLHMFVTSITAVTNNKTFTVDGTYIDKENSWFEWGVLEMLSGDNLYKKMEIKAWDNTTKQITLALPLAYVPAVGDKVRFHTGCAKSREVCHSKFNNIVNFRGEPDLPGTDQYFKVGGANTGGSLPAPGGK